MENLNEIWQTSVNGQVYETDFAGLVEWIAGGSLQPQDKVRKGNLRWIEANKVPALHRFFNAREFETNNQIVTSTNVQAPAPPQVQNFNVNQPHAIAQNFQAPPPPTFYKDLAVETEKKFCAIHTDANAKFHCETCSNYFCRACPQNGSCPMCGALCKSIENPIATPSVLPQPLSQVNQNQQVFVDEDVRKSSYWFYWKAGLTIVNSILAIAGVYWQFFLGLTVPQLLHGILIGVSDLAPDANVKLFHGIVLLMSIAGAGLTTFFGFKAGQGKKWAFVLGIIIFVFDGLLYLLTLSVFGILIHGYAVYSLSKAYSACKKPQS